MEIINDVQTKETVSGCGANHWSSQDDREY